jgi:hypothetical protein
MEAVKETTKWREGPVPNHTYLLDGSHLVAYIKQGEAKPFWFSKPIKNFGRTGRTFVKVDVALFGATKSLLREVQGSKGAVYYVDDEARTCTCAGYTFRGACKHIG